MKAVCGSPLQLRTTAGVEKSSFLGFFHQNCKKQQARHLINSNDLKLKSHRNFNILQARFCKGSNADTLKPETNRESLEGDWLLKAKGREVAECLDGRCIFLVGMMGSGKTTVGQILSEALGYTFADSDEYVEKIMGGTSLAQIFKDSGEGYFREFESEALEKLCLIPRQVIATGNGSVAHPMNWRYMRQGISVFLDVPLDALARRIAAVGTQSHPFLDFSSGDTYAKAFTALSILSKKRSEAYANADATVSFLNLAACLDLEDVSSITPATIALEVLVQTEKHLWR